MGCCTAPQSFSTKNYAFSSWKPSNSISVEEILCGKPNKRNSVQYGNSGFYWSRVTLLATLSLTVADLLKCLPENLSVIAFALPTASIFLSPDHYCVLYPSRVVWFGEMISLFRRTKEYVSFEEIMGIRHTVVFLSISLHLSWCWRALCSWLQLSY